MNYTEVDFDEVVTKKIHLLKKDEILMKIAKINETHIENKNQINSDHYKLIA